MMTDYPTEAEARLALHGVDQARQRVIDQIGMPWWYWGGLALAWAGLGVASDFANAWIGGVATIAVGAAHSTVSQRVLTGRQRRGDVKVGAGVVGRHVAALVIAFLLALVALTLAVALVLDADGAEHPATIAGVFVAVVVLLGGPRLMDAIRVSATRRAGSR
jgi:hypothetical protein